MKTMGVEALGSIVVVVHTANPPDQPSWDAYVALLKNMSARTSPEQIRSIVFTEGGGPSFTQRRQVNELLKGRTSPIAVMSSNAFIRGIVAALAVFNPKIKVFRPDAVGEAFRYLGLTEADGKAVWRTVTKLQAELGITSKRGS